MDQQHSISHDSGPRFIRFQGLSNESLFMDGEGKVVGDYGTVLDLLLLQNPGIIPAFVGPKLADLTGGNGNKLHIHLQGNPTIGTLTNGEVDFRIDCAGEPATPDSLTTGETTLDITFQDETTAHIDLTVAAFKALADAQGLGTLSGGDIDISSLCDLSSDTGKLVTSVIATNTVNWRGLASFLPDTSFLAFKIGVLSGRDMLKSVSMIDGGGGSADPEVTVGSEDKAWLTFSLNSSNPTITNDNGYVTSSILQSLSLDPTQPSESILSNANPSASGWPIDYSNLVGATITSITYNCDRAFDCVGSDPFSTQLIIGSADEGGGTLTLATLTGIGGIQGSTTIVLDTPFVVGDISPVFTFIFSMVPDTTIVDVPIAASDILAYAVTQITEFGVPDQRPLQNGPILVRPTNLFTPFVGWIVKNTSTATVTTPYGPSSIVSPSSQHFDIAPEGGPRTRIGQIDSFTVPTYTDGGEPADFGTIQAGGYLEMDFFLFPKSIPESDNPLIVSEPIELKNRNLSAFAFRFRKDIALVDADNSKRVRLLAFVSQGEAHEPVNGTGRLWTPLPLNFIDGLIVGATVLDSDSAITPIELHIVNILHPSNPDVPLPINFGAPLVMLPKERLGPWDYLRFVFLPHVDEAEQPDDYSDWTMQVVASSREMT